MSSERAEGPLEPSQVGLDELIEQLEHEVAHPPDPGKYAEHDARSLQGTVASAEALLQLARYVRARQPQSEVTLFSVEKRHLDGLRAVAARLSVVANERDTMGEEELRNMALIIMQAVRYAEVLEAFGRPGAPPRVLCELPRKEET